MIAVNRSLPSFPTRRSSDLFGHDVRDGFGDQPVGFVVFGLADRGGEAEFSDEKLVPQTGWIDKIRNAGPVLERKAAEMGEAAEHRPHAGREFRFDAAELRSQVRDLSHFRKSRRSVPVPFESLGYRRTATGPIRKIPAGAFQKP